MTGLKIVSRNPKLAPRPRRWHELACDVGRRLYVVEELVLQGEQKRWAQSIALEVIFGRGAAAKAIKPGVRKQLSSRCGLGRLIKLGNGSDHLRVRWLKAQLHT